MGVKELKRGVKELKMLGFKLLDRSIQAFSKISVVPGGGKGRGKREVALTRQQPPEGLADIIGHRRNWKPLQTENWKPNRYNPALFLFVYFFLNS